MDEVHNTFSRPERGPTPTDQNMIPAETRKTSSVITKYSTTPKCMTIIHLVVGLKNKTIALNRKYNVGFPGKSVSIQKIH